MPNDFDLIRTVEEREYKQKIRNFYRNHMLWLLGERQRYPGFVENATTGRVNKELKITI